MPAKMIVIIKLDSWGDFDLPSNKVGHSSRGRIHSIAAATPERPFAIVANRPGTCQALNEI
jgi:hypothetical protein